MVDTKTITVEAQSLVCDWTSQDGVTRQIHIKPLLNASEMNQLYNRVLSSVKIAERDSESEKNSQGDADPLQSMLESVEYKPQFLEYFWRHSVIEAYSDVELPEDTDAAYLLCYSSLWDVIENTVSSNQLSDIYMAIVEQLKIDEGRVCASMHWRAILNDMQTIMHAMANWENVFAWMADSSDKSQNPLLRKG